jgi:hypothetical protein
VAGIGMAGAAQTTTQESIVDPKSAFSFSTSPLCRYRHNTASINLRLLQIVEAVNSFRLAFGFA